MDYLKRLEKFDKLEGKRFKKNYDVNRRADEKIAKMEKEAKELNRKGEEKIAKMQVKIAKMQAEYDLRKK